MSQRYKCEGFKYSSNFKSHDSSSMLKEWKDLQAINVGFFNVQVYILPSSIYLTKWVTATPTLIAGDAMIKTRSLLELQK